MAVKGFLNQEQRENLQKAIREDDCALLREKALMLLLMNDGKTYTEISEFIGCGLRTVVYWCVHGDPDNIESLKDKREKGNHSKATDEYIQLLMETDIFQFLRYLSSQVHIARIEEDTESGNQSGVMAAPALFINVSSTG